jgi:6-phosphogluconolactonase
MNQASDVRRFQEGEAFVDAATNFILAAMREEVDKKGWFSLALSGGSTPVPVYKALAAERDAPWDRVRFFFGDERMVPPDDDRSNFKMAADALFSTILVPAENVYRMSGESLSAEQAALDYEDEVRSAIRAGRTGIASLDLILLGMGPDGHTASLFPGSPALGESHRLILGVPAPNLSPRVPRLTFTLPLINAAERVLFLVSSTGKEEALASALAPMDETTPPAGLVRPAASAVWMILDPTT